MATLSTFEILSLYQSSILKFLDSLVELFPEEADLIVMRILFEQIPIEESLKKFTIKVVPQPVFGPEQMGASKRTADMIRNKNDSFFLTDGAIFSGISGDKVIRWKQLWTSKRLDADDRNAIWQHMNLFLNLAEMYVLNHSV